MKQIHKPYGLYEAIFKPILDRILALIFVLLFWWLYIVVAILVRIKLGSPIIFKQERPGKINPKTGKEEIFYLYKFRTMTDERDKNGKLLPDEVRLTKFGKLLRSTSLEGNDIIRQTTKSLENKGFREVSPIPFFNGCNLISNDFRVMIA